MISNDPKKSAIVFCPYKYDYIYMVVGKFLGREKPFYVCLIYFIISYLTINVVGIISGQFFGKNGIEPMYMSVLDNLNLAVLAPVGAGLLCNLYNTLSKSIADIRDNGLISSSDLEKYDVLVEKLNQEYNNITVISLIFVFSFSINIFTYFTKTTSWLCINGGITSVFARFFVIINFFMIGNVIYKSIITVIALHRILKFDINVKPLHPDRAGGLSPIGNISTSLTYFLSLVVLFVTLLFVFDNHAVSNMFFISIYLSVYLFAPFIPFLSLLAANKKMEEKKREELNALHLSFVHHYNKIKKQDGRYCFSVNDSTEIVRINELYQIVERMPVWPFDFQTTKKIITSFVFPLVVFLINQASNEKGILFKYFKILIGN